MNRLRHLVKLLLQEMALLGIDLEEVGVYKPKEEESEEEESDVEVSEEEFSVCEYSVTESESEEEESKQQVLKHEESEEEYSDEVESEAESPLKELMPNGRYVVFIPKKVRRIFRRIRERRERREKMMVSHMTKTTNSRFPCLQLEVL
jgi:hypothetical protein